MKMGTEDIKNYNREQIIRYLQKVSCSTKKEIAVNTNLSITTVATILVELQNKGVVNESTRANSTGGRRAIIYTLNKSLYSMLNLQIGSKVVEIQLINIYGEFIKDHIYDIDNTATAYEDILSYIKEVMHSHPIKVIGIGVPGIVKDKGYYINNKLENIGVMIEKELGISVQLVNDLNAIAYGYMIEQHGEESSRKRENLVYIHINEDCSGAGIIINGDIIIGSDGFAGEVGYIPLRDNKTFDQIIKDSNIDDFHIAIVNLISVLNYVVNPKRIVLGGNHRLMKNISTAKLNQLIQKDSYIEYSLDIRIEEHFKKHYKQGLMQLIMNYYLKKEV